MIKNFSPRQRQILPGLTFIAFLFRLYQIGVQSLWFDESLSALFASQPLDVAIQSMLQEGGLPKT
jgi:predicted membrane-bound mannosyltransferase